MHINLYLYNLQNLQSTIITHLGCETSILCLPSGNQRRPAGNLPIYRVLSHENLYLVWYSKLNHNLVC